MSFVGMLEADGWQKKTPRRKIATRCNLIFIYRWACWRPKPEKRRSESRESGKNDVGKRYLVLAARKRREGIEPLWGWNGDEE